MSACPPSEPPETRREPVTQRRVFYLAGFDPLAPRRYREIYRKEAPRQAAISGYQITVSGSDNGLDVALSDDGVQTTARLEFLNWGDLVKASMSTNIPLTFWKMACVLWVYFGSGAFFPLFRLNRPPMLAGLYPAFMLGGQVLVGLLAGAILSLLVPVPWWVLGALCAVALLLAFRARDPLFYVYYLVYYLSMAVEKRGAVQPVLDERLDQFAERIQQALEGDADEVLLVGHSSGAALGALVLDKVLRAGQGRDGRLAFLTVGSVIPMFSFLPEAQALRRALKRLSQTEELAWIDVSAPGDGGCFALSDPVAVTGLADPAQRWPKVISAAFSETLSPEADAAHKWRFFRRHLQYLSAFDRPRDYDYFRITAGSQRLADRFRDRGSSRSAVTTPLSPYRDL